MPPANHPRGSATPTGGSSTTSSEPRGTRPDVPAHTTPGSLLEREHELERLARLCEHAANGNGRVAAIEAAAGLGKTRLLREVVARAEARGLETLYARGGEVERDFAFGVVRQLFEPVLGSDGSGPTESLASAAASARPVFAPAAAHSSSGTDPSFAVLHGLYWLVVNLTERAPLVLAVDDAHWADEPSLRFLDFLARRLEGLPVLLLAALRPADSADRGGPLGELLHEPAIEVLRPHPLSAAAVAALVRARRGKSASDQLCHACEEPTGGNPYLLEELLAELHFEYGEGAEPAPEAVKRMGPQRIASSVLMRIGRLDPSAPALVRAATVLGEHASLRHAAALARLDIDDARPVADALADAEILKQGEPLEFVHPLIRTSIYEDTPAGARAAAHLRAARLLARDGAPPEELAPHLMRAPREGDDRTVDGLSAAAREAVASGAAESAVSYLRRALEEPPPASRRGEVHAELASAEMLIDLPSACRDLERALDLLEDPARRAEIAAALASALVFSRRSSEATAVAGRALEELSDRPGTGDLRVRLEAALMLGAMHEPRLTPIADEIASRTRSDGELHSIGEKSMAALVAFHEARRCDRRAVARAERALEGGDLITAENGGAPALASYTLILADSPAGLEAIEAGLEAAHRGGSIFAFACNKVFRGQSHYLRGDLAAAIADLREAVDASYGAGHEIGHAWGAPYLADALIELGDLDGAEAVLERESSDDAPQDIHLIRFLDSRARLLAARGATAEALEMVLECGRSYEAVGGHNPAISAWRSRVALALRELGSDPAKARRLAREEVELARAWGAPRAIGCALRASGLVEGGENGLRLLGEAVATLGPSPAQLEHARSLIALGAAQRRAGDRREARESLQLGLDLAHRCGAVPLERQAREELGMTGARPRRPLLSGPEALTAAERRVAELAASGARNREIAQALFISIKTVEMHLRNGFRKLDIKSRKDLARALEEGAAAGETGAADSVRD